MKAFVCGVGGQLWYIRSESWRLKKGSSVLIYQEIFQMHLSGRLIHIKRLKMLLPLLRKNTFSLRHSRNLTK